MTFLFQSNLARKLGRRIGRLVGPPAEPPLDLCGSDLHPVEALMRAGDRRFVVDLPLSACRGHRSAAFPLVAGAGHPYLETLRELIADPRVPYRRTSLQRFYACFQPPTAADYLGIAPSHPVLARSPAGAFMPWDPPPPPDVEARRRAELERENLSHGVRLGAEHGFHHWGPVSPEKGDLEMRRLAAILERIRAEGFRLMPGHSGLARAMILTSGGEWRALVTNGQHRLAVQAALGEARAPIWPLPGPIRREDAPTWPGVTAGVFTLAQATAVFDRIFAGIQPAALAAAYWEGTHGRGSRAGSVPADLPLRGAARAQAGLQCLGYASVRTRTADHPL